MWQVVNGANVYIQNCTGQNFSYVNTVIVWKNTSVSYLGCVLQNQSHPEGSGGSLAILRDKETTGRVSERLRKRQRGRGDISRSRNHQRWLRETVCFQHNLHGTWPQDSQLVARNIWILSENGLFHFEWRLTKRLDFASLLISDKKAEIRNWSGVACARCPPKASHVLTKLIHWLAGVALGVDVGKARLGVNATCPKGVSSG